MHRVFYFFYMLVGLIIFLTFILFLLFIVPVLDQFLWIPSLIRKTISEGNAWLALGYEHSKITILSEEQIRILSSCVITFCSICLLVYKKQFHQIKALQEIKDNCVPLSDQDKARCEHLLNGAHIAMKRDAREITASVYGSDIVVSQGALDKCSDIELAGFIAHELGHVRINDSFFKIWALEARWFYIFIYRIIRWAVNHFWGITSRFILLFSSLFAIFLWSRSNSSNEKTASLVVLSIIAASVITNWLCQRILKVDIIKWFSQWLEKAEEFLRCVTLFVIKLFLYAIPINWLIIKGDDFAEYSADKYAVKLGYGKALLDGLLHIQNDEETKLDNHDHSLLRRRIRRLNRVTIKIDKYSNKVDFRQYKGHALKALNG